VRNIWEILRKQDVEISMVALYQLIKKYKTKGYVVDIPRRPRNRILNSEMMKTIDEEMSKNDELTARMLQDILKEKYRGIVVSISTIKRVRKELGWVATKPHYCQLIRQVWTMLSLLTQMSVYELH